MISELPLSFHILAFFAAPSLKSFADAYPAVYSRYLSLDSATNFDLESRFSSPRSALSEQLTVAASNRAMFTISSPLLPTPETPSTALEGPLSQGCPLEQSRPPGHTFIPHGGGLLLTSTPPLVPTSVPLLSAEYEDQGLVSLPSKISSPTDCSPSRQEAISLTFQANNVLKMADPDTPPRQDGLDSPEAQPEDAVTALRTSPICESNSTPQKRRMRRHVRLLR